MDDSLSKRGRSLEEMFFKERDAQLIEQRRQLEQLKKDADALAAVSGIKNPQILEKMVGMGVSLSTMASLAVLPLVEVAWADGQLSEKEKEAVLAGAAHNGIAAGSMDYGILESWLKERPQPQLLEAWMYYIAGLKEVLSPKEMDELRTDLLNKAKKVAQATGGLFSKISSEEQAVLKKMESVFI